MDKMKLGTKIAAGFGILIIIACVLGALGVVNMKNVETKSHMLASEYVPEVAVANELRGAANRVMYEMRGYGFTENASFYEKAATELVSVEKALTDAAELERNSPNLKALKGQIDNASAAVKEYKTLMETSRGIQGKMDEDRGRLDEGARAYMSNCEEFLAGQNKKFGVDLSEREKKINLVGHLVQYGSEARVLNFKSQATDDSALLKEGIAAIGKTKPIFEELRKITRDEEDIRRIDDTEAAARNYQAAMSSFHDEHVKGFSADNAMIKRFRKIMDENAGVYIKNCDAFLEGQQKKLTKDMTERNAKINFVSEIMNIGNQTRVATFKSQALREPKLIEDALNNFAVMDSLFGKLREITRSQEDIKRIDNTKAAADEYKQAMIDFLANWKKLQEIGVKLEDAGRTVIQACKTTADAGMNSTDVIAKDAATSLSRSSVTMIIGLVVAVVIGVFAAFFITRSITKPVNRIIDSLSESAEQVTSASGQVSSASQTLAEASSEQAANIEETSSSLEEMSSMTRQNANNAMQAKSMMSEARGIVEKVNTHMTDMAGAIGEITRTSEETGKIIKTIDEIAFQTNLLALNAAVEAARAGEAGAGFAVVADEVRNLAMRAAEAAKNTSDLIEGTIKAVQQGNELTTSTQEAFSENMEISMKVAELVDEISGASDEQAKGIEQVNKAVSEMDKVVQQNASTAEESASASEEMNAQAERLKEVVQDLVELVGGAGKTARGGHRGFQPEAPRRKAIGPPSSRARVPMKQKTAGNYKEVSPDQVIPFDEDFEEF